MSELDAAGTYERFDPSGMGGYIERLPEQFANAWEAAQGLALPDAFRGAEQVVVLGMGGSAIGGDMLRSLVALESPVPVRVVRGYGAAPDLGPRALVIASSNSGGTEETLSAIEQTLASGAMHFASTTGGRLRDLARERGLPTYEYAFPSPPRAALGYGLAPLLYVASHAGLLADVDARLRDSVRETAALRDEIAVGVPEASNPAKQLARRQADRLAVVFGAEHLGVVATRWRTQFAENAKRWAIADELPEANHNTIVGLGLPEAAVATMHAVFLDAPSLHPRVRVRAGLTREALADVGVGADVVAGRGVGAMAELLSLVLFGDYVSYYVAMLTGQDPTPIGPIDRFKARLAGE